MMLVKVARLRSVDARCGCRASAGEVALQLAEAVLGAPSMV